MKFILSFALMLMLAVVTFASPPKEDFNKSFFAIENTMAMGEYSIQEEVVATKKFEKGSRTLKGVHLTHNLPLKVGWQIGKGYNNAKL